MTQPDGDATWDYLASDKDFIMAYFGETSNSRYPKRVVNADTTISFISDSEVVELQNLSGSETVEFFEKIA